jgi:hypothetical protein
MTGVNNHKTTTVLLVIARITGVLVMGTVAIGGALADTKTITKTTTNTGVNVPTDTDQKQQCDTAGGTSPITSSCTATSKDNITQSGGVLHK